MQEKRHGGRTGSVGDDTDIYDGCTGLEDKKLTKGIEVV